MASHDFTCAICHTTLVDVHIPTGIRASTHAPPCPTCAQPTTWVPGVTAMDAGSGSGWQTFSTFDGRNQPVVIDSLRTLRRVERESEQLARNGEGQQINWRAYSQTRSNREVGSLGASPAQRPRPAFVEKFGPCVKSAEAPDLAFGPGVSEANCSALPSGVAPSSDD
jgi:hypothetical protein